VSRPDVVASFGLEEADADRLSRLILLPGNPFFAGGDAGLTTWRLSIDPRILDFEDSEGPDDLIRRVAGHRLPAPASQPRASKPLAGDGVESRASAAHEPRPPEPVGSHSARLGLVLTVLAAGVNGATILATPLPVSVAIGVTTALVFVFHKWLLPPRLSIPETLQCVPLPREHVLVRLANPYDLRDRVPRVVLRRCAGGF
jgi:hypothetical protein